MSLFQITELPSEKEAEKNTRCLQQQGLLRALSDSPLLLPLGILVPQICIPGCCRTKHNMQMERAPCILIHCLTALIFTGGEGFFVGLFFWLFYDFSFIRRELKAFKETKDSDTG